MTERIICSGFGGQGIMLLGRLIAQAAIAEGKHTTYIPAYGAEVRGGTAYCMVIISDNEIASPLIHAVDTLMVFNAPSLERFKERIHSSGLLILNKSLINQDFKKDKIKVVSVPFTELATQLGNVKVANVIALGSYLKAKNVLSIKSVEKAMEIMAPRDRRDLLEINEKALKVGLDYGKS